MRANEFEAGAKREFAFLTTERDYRCALSTPDLVRFDSPKAFVEISYDGNRSFELDVHVGLIGSKASYSIGEILRLRGAAESKELSLVQVTTNEVLATFLHRMSSALRAHGGDFVSGNEKSFAEAAAQRKKDVEAHAADREVSAARAKLEGAWRSKDYEGVVRALRPVRALLTKSEIEKLEYSERKLRS